MAFPIAAALSGIGLISQFFGNQGAGMKANSLDAQQAALIQKQIQAYDQRFKLAMDMLNSGAWDPNKAIQAANQLSLQDQGVAQNNAAASSRALGYKPGDSVPGRNQEAINERYRASRQANNLGIASGLRQEALAAFDPSTASVLNPGIQTYGNQAAGARAGIQPLGAALANLGSFFPDGGSGGRSGNNLNRFGRSMASGFKLFR